MSELRILLLAATVWIAALAALPVHPLVPVPLTMIALFVRNDLLLILSVGLLSTGLAARADARHQPLAAARFEGEATLVTDPEPSSFGWRAEARLEDGSRVRVRASGPPAWALERGVAGERWQFTGHITPAGDEPWLRSRHILGHLAVGDATRVSPPYWWRLPSEALRRGVAGGASELPPHLESLYLGLVIGDDRFQPRAQQSRFRAAGLTHLLAVSGQNVAFALAVVGPLLRRLPLTPRLIASLIVLTVFAVATRLEPSVVRATMTAAIASTALWSSARASGTRALALAVTVLVLIDPFLTVSVGFQLSVAASLGILVLGPALRSRLPGPDWLREPLAITLSAQLGVAPILMSTFGPVSAITIPANLLAGWAAGAVMTWGLSVGLIAGLLPAPLDGWIQVPATVLVWWIDTVARVSARMPAPRFDGPVLAVLIAQSALAWMAWPQRSSAAVRRGLLPALLAAAALLLIVSVPTTPHSATDLPGGGRYWPPAEDTPSILVISSAAHTGLVDALVAHRIHSVDVVVSERGHASANALVTQVRDVVDIRILLAPPQHRVVGARRLLQPITLALADGGAIMVQPIGERIEITVEP